MMAAWAIASLFWSRSGDFGDLIWLTVSAWASSACAAAAARRPAPQAAALGAVAGAVCSAAGFVPLHRPGWLAAGIAASILAAALWLPFATYGDIALASRGLVRAATGIVVTGWVTYLVFVRPLAAPTPAGQAVATAYPCLTMLAAVATARAAHRLTYGSRLERAWFAPIALAVAFRDVPVRLLKAVVRLSITTAGLVAAGAALVAILPRIARPRAVTGRPTAANHPPLGLRQPAAAAHTAVPMPLVLTAAAVAVALLVALGWMARGLVRNRELSRTPEAVPSRITQRRIEDGFRLVPTSEPVRVRMQQRLRAWHRTGHTLARAETIRSLVGRLPDELRDPGDPALLRAYEQIRYGPDEP
ncbi:hypothetical protein TC41_2270 [Alicyclobacillus acidocaldarius subsp. acidocaldarius Tc-4-1]|uniref:DUF4129 domain-containing protein n=2 Tax=Alicyclobacillus acidocaldarius TaxID=405212 RepID=F8IG20_ALIAT|nr:hypothetical protein TC41_2270 [Alicyclobacillus acidocaldarius subsp. acidocaldarius Tc-4-1]